MANFKLELNDAGIQELLKSPEMQAIVHKEAENVVNRVGGAYELSTYVGKKRCNVSICTSDEETYRDNLENNTLLKAVGG